MAPTRAAHSTRTAVRSLPQETTGPRLRILPRRRASGRAVLTMGAALFFVLLAGSVTIQAHRIELQHRIDQLDADLLAAHEQQRVLRAEVAVAESPERIMEAARGLGMIDPGPVLPLVPTVEPPPAPAAQNPPPAPATPADGGPVALGAASDGGESRDAEGPDGGG